MSAIHASTLTPAKTELNIRLNSRVSSATSKPGDPVAALVIAPVEIEGRLAIPTGVSVQGKVERAEPAPSPTERAHLAISFHELRDKSGKRVPLSARLVKVDNARESVDENGAVVGIVAAESLSARMDQGIERLAASKPQLADLLATAKAVLVRQTDPEIDYGQGVEMVLQLTEPLVWPDQAEVRSLRPIADRAALIELVNRQPHRTTAGEPPKPSDITNLLFIGTADALERAFHEAGWSGAAALNSKSAMETFRAIVEVRGYKEAPMSVLHLEGQRSDYDFQKQNNTFAQRHHVRIWSRPEVYAGKPVWVGAATHDIGIDLSPETRTFIHVIDPEIDQERAKIVNDLLFTGRVASHDVVERPGAPKRSTNATGDDLITDGRMAVLVIG
ncbi:MAG: LssY C-terminal domain-containing protein [Bryobacteraceae bacterium]